MKEGPKTIYDFISQFKPDKNMAGGLYLTDEGVDIGIGVMYYEAMRQIAEWCCEQMVIPEEHPLSEEGGEESYYSEIGWLDARDVQLAKMKQLLGDTTFCPDCEVYGNCQEHINLPTSAK